jgi:hypothetical protein
MSDFKCNTVFHQSGGLICEKTLKIQKLQAQLKDANETIKFYSSKTTIFSASLEVDSNNDYCEPSGSIARKYLEKYKAVSNE